MEEVVPKEPFREDPREAEIKKFKLAYENELGQRKYYENKCDELSKGYEARIGRLIEENKNGLYGKIIMRALRHFFHLLCVLFGYGLVLAPLVGLYLHRAPIESLWLIILGAVFLIYFAVVSAD